MAQRKPLTGESEVRLDHQEEVNSGRSSEMWAEGNTGQSEFNVSP